MAKRKVQPAAVEAGTFDPEKSYEVDVVRVVPHPVGGRSMMLRPINNPYRVKGSVAAALGDAVCTDTVKELTD